MTANEIKQKESQYVMQTYGRFDLVLDHGCGATLYDTDGKSYVDMTAGGTKFLRIRSLATSFMFLSFFTVHMFQGFGKGNTALFLGVVRWAVLNIPMLFLLNHLLGMYGLVWGQLCADVITSALSLAVYLRFKRRMHLEPNR